MLLCAPAQISDTALVEELVIRDNQLTQVPNGIRPAARP
jgi:hypothetical protein